MSFFLTSKWQPTQEQQWRNVFQLRTTKYRNWFQFLNSHRKSSIGVRYETLLEDAEGFFETLKTQYGIPCTGQADFKSIDSYVKFKRIDQKKPAFKDKAVRRFTEVEERIIARGIDPEIEAALGYA